MGNTNKNLSGNLASGTANRITGALAPVTTGLEGRYNLDQASADIAGGMAMSGTAAGQASGGFDPTQLQYLRGQGKGLTEWGGYDPAQWANLYSDTQGATTTGGFDPTLLAKVVSGSGATYDPTSLSNIRQGYTSMAQSGGFTPQDISNYLNTATSGVSGAYSVLGAEAREAAQQGGGSGAAAISQMARQGAQSTAQADIAARSGLQQQITANKLAGLGGLQMTESDVAKLAQSGAGILGGVAGQQAALKMQGLGQQATQQAGLAAGRQQGFGQAAGLETGVAGGETSANAQMYNKLNMLAGKSASDINHILQSIGLDASTSLSASQVLANLSSQPGLTDKIFKDIAELGQGVGAAAAGIKG